MKIPGQRLDAQPEHARNFLEMQPEEILDLRARDQHRNPIRKSNYDRPRNEFHSRAQARDAHDHQQHAGHHGAHEQSIHAVHRDDPRHHHHKRAGRPANLHLRSAQRRNQKSGDDRAVNSSLRRQPRSDGKRHRQRQCHQPHGDSSNQIQQKFVTVVVAKTQHRLRKPILTQESTRHFPIIAPPAEIR